MARGPNVSLNPDEVPDLPALAAIPTDTSTRKTGGERSDNFSRGWTAAELMCTDFPEPRWAVRGFFPEGATLLAGESKIGKSWMGLGLSIAVASGGRAFGHIPVEAGRVLYIGFEDNPRRMRSRLSRLLEDQPAPERLHIYHEWPKLGLPESSEKSGIDWLNAWMRKYPDTRLVVVDTFKLIRPNRKRHGNIYDEDYEDSHALQQFAGRAGVALLGIHHTNQGRHEDDPFHAISGSEGLNAGFDTIAVLRRSATSSAGSLNIRG
ncbi:MAG: AAA family ATPase, partial [Fimbriimonadales bacterium]